jgi:hypothetical protein
LCQRDGPDRQHTARQWLWAAYPACYLKCLINLECWKPENKKSAKSFNKKRLKIIKVNAHGRTIFFFPQLETVGFDKI